MQTHPSSQSDSQFCLLCQSAATHLRLLNTLSLLLFAGGMTLAFMVLHTPALALGSEATRLGWVAFVLFFAGTCPVWAAAYSGRQATRVSVSRDGRFLRVVQPTLTGFAARDVAVDDVVAMHEIDDSVDGERPSSVAPVQIDLRDDSGFVVSFEPGHEAERTSLMRTLQH